MGLDVRDVFRRWPESISSCKYKYSVYEYKSQFLFSFFFWLVLLVLEEYSAPKYSGRGKTSKGSLSRLLPSRLCRGDDAAREESSNVLRWLHSCSFACDVVCKRGGKTWRSAQGKTCRRVITNSSVHHFYNKLEGLLATVLMSLMQDLEPRTVRMIECSLYNKQHNSYY